MDGAFTWGVLDRVLEEDWTRDRGDLRHLGGDMTPPSLPPATSRAAARARERPLSGLGARALGRGRASALSAQSASMSCSAAGPSTTRRSSWPMDLMSRVVSPTASIRRAQPFGRHPRASIDFGASPRTDPPLPDGDYRRTGRGRVFRNHGITPEVLLASACLPTLFQPSRSTAKAIRRRRLLGIRR